MNYIPQIAKMLGVEIGEKFLIDNVVITEGCYCYFSDTELLFHIPDKKPDYAQYRPLADLIYGDKKIIKLPYEPKEGEKYYFIILTDNKPTVNYTLWHSNYLGHWEGKYCGNIFRTAEEAEAHKYEIYKKLTGKEWKE